jgi:2-polyprenyl-3-methyl-5-hydroxy-6-metoxy-1,4-benzoquinol methylase
VTGQVTGAVPTGNTYDKYGSTNPVVKRLMAGFDGALDELWAEAAPESALDVGCGEGVLTERFAERLGTGQVVGVDLDDPKLRAEWDRRARPNLDFRPLAGPELPFAKDEFDIACAIEVLEHVPDPARTLAELVRVARSHVLASVPREPLWRALNMLRGAYVRDLGNTPGHVNHWSRGAFLDFVNQHGRIAAIRSPFPWTMVLVRTA